MVKLTIKAAQICRTALRFPDEIFTELRLSAAYIFAHTFAQSTPNFYRGSGWHNAKFGLNFSIACFSATRVTKCNVILNSKTNSMSIVMSLNVRLR